jgi:hypothetical protein
LATALIDPIDLGQSMMTASIKAMNREPGSAHGART